MKIFVSTTDSAAVFHFLTKMLASTCSDVEIDFVLCKHNIMSNICYSAEMLYSTIYILDANYQD